MSDHASTSINDTEQHGTTTLPKTSYISNLQYVTTGGAVLLFLRAFNHFITHRQRGQALVGAATCTYLSFANEFGLFPFNFLVARVSKRAQPPTSWDLDSSRKMATPSVMLFPPSKYSSTAKRTLILRNPTNKDFVIKLVPSCKKTLILEGEVLLLQQRKYAPVSITLDQKIGTKAELSIYARPVEPHNHLSLLKFCKDSTEVPRQLMAKLAVKVENGFSANDTILDVPGRAAMFEPVTVATAGIAVSDTITCEPIDGDCATAPNMDTEEFARYTNQKLGEEKCWLFGPLIDAIFPPAATKVSKQKSTEVKKAEKESCNPCAS